jgi:hypothetical protein
MIGVAALTKLPLGIDTTPCDLIDSIDWGDPAGNVIVMLTTPVAPFPKLKAVGLELVATRPEEVIVMAADIVVVPPTVATLQPVVSPVLLA